MDQSPEPNCEPGEASLDTTTGELKGELVSLYAPLPTNDYQALRAEFLSDKKAQKKLGASLPESLLNALCVDTAELRKQGWSQPPAARKVSYLRPVDALRSRRGVPVVAAPAATAMSFILTGKPLPRVEDSLRVGELMRAAVMHGFKNNVPPIISGHDLPKGNRHGHAFYLPWDSNGDGRIDRVLVHVPEGIDAEQQRIVATVRRVWERGGSEWRLVLEGIGDHLIAPAIAARNTTLESSTPWLHPWHVKKRFTPEDQLRRECRERHLPDLVSTEPFDQVNVGKGRQCRPVQFQRFRKRRLLNQPDLVGGFWRLTFAEPVTGPLALGFACHYGLGLFKPTKRGMP